MKRKFVYILVGLVLLAIGFASGCFIQQSRSGYHYDVRDTKDYDSPMGLVRWSYVTESIGTAFLDPGTTTLEIDGRTIYKAKRGFQESAPYARNITTSKDRIQWEDGDFRFDLTLQRMKTDEQNPSAESDLARQAQYDKEKAAAKDVKSSEPKPDNP